MLFSNATALFQEVLTKTINVTSFYMSILSLFCFFPSLAGKTFILSLYGRRKEYVFSHKEAPRAALKFPRTFASRTWICMSNIQMEEMYAFNMSTKQMHRILGENAPLLT